MGYWLLRTYGLWCANPRPPSWWTKKYMGFRGLWVIKVMGYEGVNCTYLLLCVALSIQISNGASLTRPGVGMFSA